MDIDFDKLRKMPPDRKLKALKEVQEKLNELIRERAKEISKSEQEIKDAQDFLKEAEDELRVLEEMEGQAPGIRKVDVEKLFERNEKPVAAPKGRELDDIAAEAPRAPPGQDAQAYISNLARQPITSIYERINTIREDIQNTGILTAYQQEKLGQFRDALHEKEEAIRRGEYAAGKKSAHLLTAAERAVMYASGTDHGKGMYTRHDNQ
jgi:predicted nuclease with TOPRIM domain